MTDTSNADQIAFWNGASGRKWAEDQAKLDAMMAPLAEAALAVANARPGESVVDIGCGTGATAVALSDAVGPEGRVLGVDVSQPMLAVARARGEGRANLSFAEADAAAHPFTPASADLVFSKFGVMFFTDPEAAFRNIRKAAKPGGRLAFICWRGADVNPFFDVPGKVAAKYAPPGPPADPYAPGPTAFADDERTAGILSRAGFAHPLFAEFEADWVIGQTPEAAAKEGLTLGPAARIMREASDAARAAFVEDLTGIYRDLMTPQGVTFKARCWVVTAGV
jgi:SAM-dependent methyltransferase